MRQRQLALLLSLPFALVALGTAGYVSVEGWSLFDALYMSVISLTTVGYMEIHPLTQRAGCSRWSS